MQLPAGIQLPENKKAKEEDNQIRDMVSNFLEPKAMERLDRVYLVNPTKAKQVEQIVLNQAQQGQVQPKSVTEDQIKKMLEALSNPAANGSDVIVGDMQDCCGEGKVVLQKRVGLLDGVKDKGDDELSF